MTDVKQLLEQATPLPWGTGSYYGQAEQMCKCEHKGKLLAKKPQSVYPEAGPFHVHEDDHYDDGHQLCGPAPNFDRVAGNYDYEEGGIVGSSNRDLILYAVNSLPAYEEAVDVLADVATRRCQSYGIAGDKCRCDTCRARAALSRLRGPHHE